jgi:hypothetical protein
LYPLRHDVGGWVLLKPMRDRTHAGKKRPLRGNLLASPIENWRASYDASGSASKDASRRHRPQLSIGLADHEALSRRTA